MRTLLPLLLLAALPAAAQEDRPWAFQVTPYAWGSGVGGEVTPVPGSPTLEFDQSLPDVLEDLDAAFFVTAFGRYGRWVGLVDLSASASSREGVVPPGIPAEGEVSQRSLTLLGGYRLQADPRATLDLLAGIRAWDVGVSAAVPLAGLSASADVSFTDPIVAARATYALSPRLSATLYADLGGWGVGSEATNQQVATLNYALTDRLTLSSGWRRLHVDYEGGGEGGGPDFEATVSGPLAGLTWRF